MLIQVAAAGVNRPDVLQRMGFYPPPPGHHRHPWPARSLAKSSTSRRMSAASTSVRRCARSLPAVDVPLTWQHRSCNACRCHAASRWKRRRRSPETWFTVFYNVIERGELKSGETLLIHGGSSGIGTTAIALGKAFGARVFVTAGNDRKCAACIELGADRGHQLP